MIRLSNYEIKAKILLKSSILRQTNPYEDVFVCADMTKAEQARHRLLVEQLKSQRARGKTDTIIQGDSIVTRSKSQRQQTEKQKSRSGSLEVMNLDNTSSFHQATVDPDYLCAVTMMMNVKTGMLIMKQIIISL